MKKIFCLLIAFVLLVSLTSCDDTLAYEGGVTLSIPEEYQDGSLLFETPATLNDTWGYKAYDQNWKRAEEIIRIKNHLNDRNINYLLNVGPDYLGRIPAPSVDILREVGK